MATQPWRCASPSLPGICVSEFSRQHTMALSQASNHGDPQATIVDGMEGGAAVLQSGGSRRIHTPLSCESMIHECHFHMGAPCMRRARACAVSPPAEPLGGHRRVKCPLPAVAVYIAGCLHQRTGKPRDSLHYSPPNRFR